VDEIADALRVSTKTVRRDLAFSEAWLCRQMEAGHP
jgi:DeoR/GlpR family transcriptional regulator of sugar metabolism